jgi:hypothetical protein
VLCTVRVCVCVCAGGLGTAKAGSAFAQLVAGRISRASECVSDDSTVTAQSHTRLHTHTHTVTSLHKALAITVLRRTSSVAAMTSFLREGGLKTVVKWLYVRTHTHTHLTHTHTHTHTHIHTIIYTHNVSHARIAPIVTLQDMLYAHSTP